MGGNGGTTSGALHPVPATINVSLANLGTLLALPVPGSVRRSPRRAVSRGLAKFDATAARRRIATGERA
jgi:hypothetical protein